MKIKQPVIVVPINESNRRTSNVTDKPFANDRADDGGRYAQAVEATARFVVVSTSLCEHTLREAAGIDELQTALIKSSNLMWVLGPTWEFTRERFLNESECMVNLVPQGNFGGRRRRRRKTSPKPPAQQSQIPLLHLPVPSVVWPYNCQHTRKSNLQGWCK